VVRGAGERARQRVIVSLHVVVGVCCSASAVAYSTPPLSHRRVPRQPQHQQLPWSPGVATRWESDVLGACPLEISERGLPGLRDSGLWGLRLGSRVKEPTRLQDSRETQALRLLSHEECTNQHQTE